MTSVYVKNNDVQQRCGGNELEVRVSGTRTEQPLRAYRQTCQYSDLMPVQLDKAARGEFLWCAARKVMCQLVSF
jgi:hypothetical protein